MQECTQLIETKLWNYETNKWKYRYIHSENKTQRDNALQFVTAGYSVGHWDGVLTGPTWTK